MPEKTLNAFADHGEVHGDTVTGFAADAQDVMDGSTAPGVSYDDVVAALESEGVEKFKVSWTELENTVRAQLDQASTR